MEVGSGQTAAAPVNAPVDSTSSVTHNDVPLAATTDEKDGVVASLESTEEAATSDTFVVVRNDPLLELDVQPSSAVHLGKQCLLLVYMYSLPCQAFISMSRVDFSRH